MVPALAADTFEIRPKAEAITCFTVAPEPARFRLHHFVIDEETRSLFRTERLSPADWAVLLDRLRATGATQLLVTAPLSWEEPDELALRALEHSLTTFRISVTGTDAALLPLPSESLAKLEGVASTLPDLDFAEVNSTPDPPSVIGSSLGLRAFPYPSGKGRPLLAKWTDELVPSLEASYLRALARLENPQAQFDLSLDHSQLSLGDFFIPLDPKATPLLPTVLSAPDPRSASEILLSPQPFDGLVLLSEDSDNPELQRMAATLPVLATSRRRNDRTFPLLTFVKDPVLATAAFITLILVLLLARTPLQALLATPILLSLPFVSFYQFQRWLPATPLLLALLTSTLFYAYLRRKKRLV